MCCGCHRCPVQSCHDPVAIYKEPTFLCCRCAHLESYAVSHPKVQTLPDISCALCPRLGGVFKPTDKGLWVHLFCSLLTPGVAFNVPESLTEISLRGIDKRVRCWCR